MNPTLLPFAAVVAGGVIYQLGMKAVPSGVNGFAVLAGAYALATAICLAASRFVDPTPRLDDVTHWPVLVVTAGLVLIEAGFLFAYRGGAKLGLFSFLGLTAASAVLLAVGAFAYGERLTGREWAGVVVCLVGLFLMKSGGAAAPP